MKRNVKRVLALVLCAVLLCGILPATHASAAERVTTQENMTHVQEISAGVYTRTEEIVTKTRVVTERPAANTVSTMAIDKDEYGDATFTTFADLQKLVAEADPEQYSSFYYAGEGELVIEADLKIPENVWVVADIVRIPVGVTLNGMIESEYMVVDGTLDLGSGYFQVKHMTVNGTVNLKNDIYVVGSLDITGKIYCDGYISMEGGAKLTGAENIVFGKYAYLTWYYTISDMSKLKAVVTEAASVTDAHWEYVLLIDEADIVVSESLTIPANCWFNIGKKVTIVSGCTLTVEGGGNVYDAVDVQGTLCNKGYIYFDHWEEISISFTKGGTYTGSGILEVSGTDLQAALPGLDLSLFDIMEMSGYYDYHYWELHYADGLTKAGTPTDPEWGYFHPESVARPGTVSWKTAGPDLNTVLVQLYLNGQLYDSTVYSYNSAAAGTWRSLSYFSTLDLENGTYQFAVTSLGDYANYRNSDTVTSGTWTYTKPAAKVGTPVNLKWSGSTAQWDAPADAAYVGGYELTIYADYGPVYYAWWYGDDTSYTLDEDFFEDWGAGDYYFEVRALSSDITKASNGEWAYTTEPHYLDGVEKPDIDEPVDPNGQTTPMYRLYNPNSGEHFYTGSVEEREILAEAGWNYEGVSWNAPIKGGTPVHRVYNPNSGDHHYTMDQKEVDMLVNAGWQYEGVAWNSASSDNIPLFRLWNPNADCGSHHYTSSEEERDILVDAGWILEGIGWYGMLK